MTRAIESLSRFVGGAKISFSSFDADFLGEWVGRQFYDGYYAKTVAYNISKIAALYNKAVEEGIAESNDAFASILSKINNAGARFDGINHTDSFRKLQMIYRTDYSTNSQNQIAKDIILFGIFNGGMTLADIASFKKEDYIGDNIHIKNIVERYSKPKNKYLFPLHQTHSTPKRLQESVRMLVGLFLKTYTDKRTGDLNNILIDMWGDIAMNCGIPTSEIASCLSNTGVSTALTAFASSAEVGTERISEIRNQVIEVLTDNPVHWYAMHLRRQTDYKELTDRLKDKKIELEEIFYPMEEIIHKVGKKMVFENKPIISWLIFYRARVTQLNKIFHEVGDLAWGYRYLRDIRSPYAVIPNSEIRDYQQAIGTLSPSTKMMSDSDIEFNEGDYLVVLGGPLNGRHGVFLSEKNGKGDASGRVIFRISLAGGNNVNWEVNWDPRLVKKISENQYKELDSQFQKNLNTVE